MSKVIIYWLLLIFKYLSRNKPQSSKQKSKRINNNKSKRQILKNEDTENNNQLIIQQTNIHIICNNIALNNHSFQLINYLFIMPNTIQLITNQLTNYLLSIRLNKSKKEFSYLSLLVILFVQFF
ncbi:hypothetical protein ABPG72_018209 [Tetrahymena utriculariae]